MLDFVVLMWPWVGRYSRHYICHTLPWLSGVLATYFNTLYRASFIILCYEQQRHNYFTNYHTPTCFDTIVSSSGNLLSIPYQFIQIAPPEEQCHNSKSVIFQEKLLKVLECYNFLWVQRRHNCTPAASFANCVMTLYLLKVHLQTFRSMPIIQKFQISSCDGILLGVRSISNEGVSL